jgi:ABC-type glycerol-3-phosphate transport system substrate-binding protein
MVTCGICDKSRCLELTRKEVESSIKQELGPSDWQTVTKGRMKMKHKSRVLLATLVSLALLLSACATAAEPTTPAVTEGPAPTEAVQPTAPGEVIHLTYMRFAEGSQVEFQLVDEWNKLHPDIQVAIDTVPAEDNYPKLVLTTQAGNPPDVYLTYFTLGASSNGMAMDLGPFLERDKGFFEQYDESGWVFHEYAGKYYAVPWRVSPSMVIVNTKLLEKAGLEVPTEWTWEQFIEYAKAMTHPENDEYGFCIMGSSEDPGTDYQFYPFLFQAGGVMIGADGLSAFNSQAGYDAIQFLSDMVNVYKVVPPGTTSATANTCIDLLAADKVGMWTNASLWLGIIRSIYPDVQITVAPMPTHTTSGDLTGGTGIAISPLTKHPDAAWEFVKFMTSTEAMRRWAVDYDFLPANVSLLNDPAFFEAAPEQRVVADVLKTQRQWPLAHYPESFDLESILRSYMQAVYLGDMTAKDALSAAAAEWDPILQKYVADDWWSAWLR